MDLLADVLQAGVAHERAWKQAGFAQDLESVADTDHKSASSSKFLDRLHGRSESGDGARAQVVAIGETAWNDDGIALLQVLRLMPDHAARLLGDFRHHVVGVMVAVRAREDDHAKFHCGIAPNLSLAFGIKQ